MFKPVNLHKIVQALGVDLDAALEQLRALYTDIDARLLRTCQGLDLPCGAGCDECCHHAVFVTPLEFFALWDDAQRHLNNDALESIVVQGRQIFADNKELILKIQGGDLSLPTRSAMLRSLNFACPILSSQGICQVYAMRELYGRLFGNSFNADSGIYGCDLVGKHLGGQELTLLSAPAVSKQLETLPLTFIHQVIPYYIELLYGSDDVEL